MKRALLLFNPEATSVSPAVRDVIAHALAADLALEVVETKRRHHATHLASGAAHEGFDIVACLGGDGTLNEVVNGLVGTDVAVVHLPGGGTNVFARTLGLPGDPIEATAAFLRHLEAGVAPRRISVGRVNGRAFVSNAGVGLDAAIVRSVERRFRLKQRLGEAMFVMVGLKTFFLGYQRRDAPITALVDGAAHHDLRTVIVCNADPYTFLGRRSFRLCPGASHDAGLDVLGLHSLRTATALRVLLTAFGSARHGRFRSIVSLHDAAGFEIECARPLPLQVDGDDAGDGTRFRFESLPGALSVMA